MTKVIYFSLAGGLATILALSLIKRKPSMRKIPITKEMMMPEIMTPETEAKFQQNLAAIGIKQATPTQVAALRTYVPVKGDRPTAIMARFSYTGKDTTPWMAVNPQNPALNTAKIIKIPANLKDLGPRPQATGKVQ